jgi:hypothetical protein
MLLGMRTRVPVLLAIVGLLMFAAVVAEGDSAVPAGEGTPLLSFLRIPQINLPQTPRGRQVERPEPPGFWTDFIGWGILLLPFVLLILAMITAVVLGLRGRTRREPTQRYDTEEPEYAEQPVARLRKAAEAARAVFAEHEGGPPGDAVIAAWLRLEDAAARSGTRRRAHETPTEFTAAVSAGHTEIAAALGELRRLYHRARFGRAGAVGPTEAAAARAALERIVTALTPDDVVTR